MIIEKKPRFQRQLASVLLFIAQDKKGAALEFERVLDRQIKSLPNFPYKFRKSIYFEEEGYRDLIFKGYTIIYKVESERILILEIFKWHER
jgi:plasmid stabilization system protein ParE